MFPFEGSTYLLLNPLKGLTKSHEVSDTGVTEETLSIIIYIIPFQT